MGIIFIYGLIGFFFGFNFSMDYFSKSILEKKVSYVVMIAVAILVVFPFGFILWPFICLRSIYHGLNK